MEWTDLKVSVYLRKCQAVSQSWAFLHSYQLYRQLRLWQDCHGK